MQTKITNDFIDENDQKVFESFKRDFKSIKEKGFVQSHRSHNTGIGKTFEDLVGVTENNNLLVDYQGVLELKSSRAYSGSMVTLFTKSPLPDGINTVLRENFGETDEDTNGFKILHTTIMANQFNTYKSKYGFKLHIDDSTERIYIHIKDLNSSEIVFERAYYNYSDLKKIIETKCKYIAFIEADSKNENGNECFHFSKATLLKGFSFEKFLHHLKMGNIRYDIRIGVYKSGTHIGRTHDHGSGFRIVKASIPNVFDLEEI